MYKVRIAKDEDYLHDYPELCGQVELERIDFASVGEDELRCFIELMRLGAIAITVSVNKEK